MMIVKRLLQAVLALAVGLAAVAGVIAWKTFGSARPLPATGLIADGKALLIVDGGYVGVFVVPLATEGHVLLVDCGNDKDARAVKAMLFDKKLTVDAIFVTHGHPDHISGCAALQQGGAPLYALAKEAANLAGAEATNSPVGTVAGAHHLGVKVDRALSSGDAVVVDGTTIHAWEVPGHTAGSAAYLMDGVLFLGDAATLGKDGRIIDPPWFFSDDVRQGSRSLGLLGDILRAPGAPPLEWMVFSHSAPLQVIPGDTVMQLAARGPVAE